jgi:hypothetical protein
MMAEIKAEFGRPFAQGQKCIYKDDPKEIYTVERSGQENTYINIGKGGTSVKTSDLTWIPTIAEIQREFNLDKDPGHRQRYKNFIDHPEDYGYSRKCGPLKNIS